MYAVTNTSNLFKSLNGTNELLNHPQTIKKSDALNSDVQTSNNHKTSGVNGTDIQKSSNNTSGVNGTNVQKSHDYKHTQDTTKTQHTNKSSEVNNSQDQSRTQAVRQQQSFEINDSVDISDRTMDLLQGFMDLLGQLLDSSQNNEDTEDLLGMLQSILDELGGGEQISQSFGSEFEFFNQNDEAKEQERSFYADENNSNEDKMQHFHMKRAMRAYGAA